MRCFACDLDLNEATPLDRPTGRFYCYECFEQTLEVQLAAAASYIDWGKAKEAETQFSFLGLAEILETEGWETMEEMLEDIRQEETDFDRELF